jgi:hypothetical protein
LIFCSFVAYAEESQEATPPMNKDQVGEHAKLGEAVGANVIIEFELTGNRYFSTDCAAVFPAESRDASLETFVPIRR